MNNVKLPECSGGFLFYRVFVSMILAGFLFKSKRVDDLLDLPVFYRIVLIFKVG